MAKHIHVHVHTSDDFSEKDHPRAKNGQFGAGGGSASAKKALPPMKYPAMVKSAKGAGLVPAGVAFHNDFEDLPAAKTVRGHKPHDEQVSLTSIVPTQSHVKLAVVEAYMQAQTLRHATTKQLPEVMKHGGKYYLLDGHHRIASRVASRHRLAQVHVVGEFQ
jgi:hypothetical protein